jgi:hypothetical protein
MAHWLSWQNTDRPALLTRADLALSQTPPPGVPGGYAMGWQQLNPPDGPVRVEHTGVLSTFSAAQALLPATRYGFALLYNANSLAVRAVQLRRLSRWQARRVGRSWWTALPGVLIPAASGAARRAARADRPLLHLWA